MKSTFILGQVDRFHKPVPNPVFIKPVSLSNRFHFQTGFTFKPVSLSNRLFGTGFNKKTIVEPVSQKYFKFNLNFGSFIDIFLVYLKQDFQQTGS